MNNTHNELLRAAQAAILADRTLRYKRNALLLGLLLAGTYLYPLDFARFSVFGIGLQNDVDTAKVAFFVAVAAFAYNTVLFVIFGIQDFLTWNDNLTGNWPGEKGEAKNGFIFPSLKMYWKWYPSRSDLEFRLGSGHIDRFVEWAKFETSGKNLSCYASMKQTPPNRNAPPTDSSLFSVPVVIVRAVKRNVWTVVVFQILPLVLVVGALFYFAIYPPV